MEIEKWPHRTWTWPQAGKWSQGSQVGEATSQLLSVLARATFLCGFFFFLFLEMKSEDS